MIAHTLILFGLIPWMFDAYLDLHINISCTSCNFYNKRRIYIDSHYNRSFGVSRKLELNAKSPNIRINNKLRSTEAPILWRRNRTSVRYKYDNLTLWYLTRYKLDTSFHASLQCTLNVLEKYLRLESYKKKKKQNKVMNIGLTIPFACKCIAFIQCLVY